MTDTQWQTAQAVAQRNGLDVAVLYLHTTSHHQADPHAAGWTVQLEQAAACLHTRRRQPAPAGVR